MATPRCSRISTSYNATSTVTATTKSNTSSSYPSHYDGRSAPISQTVHGRRSGTARPGTARPSSGRRSRAGSIPGCEAQQIICAVSEGRGITPIVGLAFVNISSGEAVMSQICDNQFYARTLNKLQVFDPTEILIVSTSGPPNLKSKLSEIIEENILGARITAVDRRYWSETSGLEYIQHLAFKEDVEAIKVAIGGNYFATCCISAALNYIDLNLSLTFAYHSLRIKYQSSEGSMLIDLSTIHSLEIVQNLRNHNSKDCLFGLMNETLTPMGSRLLRSSILQPSTQKDVLEQRYEALEELSNKEEMFIQIRQALKPLPDIERLLTSLIITPKEPDIKLSEQSINNILMLKSFVQALQPLFVALSGARSDLLTMIRDHFRAESIAPTLRLINEVINEDVAYQKTPLELRNQRIYAVRSGVNGFLDVARQTFKEATEDVHQHVIKINEEHEIHAEIRYDTARRYWLRLSEEDFDGRSISEIFIHRVRKKGYIECLTLDLKKLNQRIEDSHQEVVLMSDQTVQDLLEKLRGEIPILFRTCESIAMLDMTASFGQLVTSSEEYTRPEILDCIAIKFGRHPVREKIHKDKFIPNDVYASQQTRFQIITGCNMSGKSTYIRSIALMSVMAQVGCFVPAHYASFPLVHQLFARVSMDDSMEANISTFASEMRETAYILRNINKNSIAIIDELGRGTSTRDGLAIALSVAEALVDSKALVWFATHFIELAQIMKERSGVVNLHLEVDMSEHSTMTMLYKIGQGHMDEQHYGLALARVLDLPREVLEIAETVSEALTTQAAAKKNSSTSIAVTRRRKLVLALKEVLRQAESGPKNGKALFSWLRELQLEFVQRMEAIEYEITEGEAESLVEKEIDQIGNDDGEKIM